jgi:hypothetical protein
VGRTFAPPTDENDDLLKSVGMTLLAVQWTERILEAALPVSFSKGAMTYTSVKADQAALRRKTLGNLTRALGERAELRPEFEALLNEFVESRNVFAHHLGARFDVGAPEGKRGALLFCGRLEAVARGVAEALSGTLRARVSEVFMQFGVQISPAEFPSISTYDDARKVVLIIEQYLHPDVDPADEGPLSSAPTAD